MAAYEELVSKAGEAALGEAPADAHHPDTADVSFVQTNTHHEDGASADVTSDVLDHPIPTASPSKKGLGVALKPIIAVLTTQYVIVTALAALAAVTVAAEAAKIINGKLDLIFTALKRF